VVSHGVPSKDSVGRFIKPIMVSSLQAFNVGVTFNSFGQNSQAGTFAGVGAGGADITADLSPLQFINQFDGLKQAGVVLGGHITRDIN
jgi:hypothetical protein